MQAEASALASLAISRDVQPPLSIGLLGDWGTGKSFFMDLMSRRVRDITRAAAELQLGAYCKHVRQITFNLSHYADSNVVAALATAVFGELQAADGDDSVARRKAQSKLVDFIAERERDREYSPTGPTMIARRDFQTLSALLSAGSLDADTDRPDRIVIYIDDVDNCSSGRVVEVLQAIHVLLSFPLFVVVVAGNAGWLLNSVRTYYTDLGGPVERLPTEDAAVVMAASESYLEKVLQIPFAILPMDQAGYRHLVRANLESDYGNDPTPQPTPDSASFPPQAADAGSEQQSLANDLEPNYRRLTSPEVDFIGGLAGLVRTPRSAIRLMNTYRLLRALTDSHQLQKLIGGEYREVVVLLTAVVHSSLMGARFFSAIDQAAESLRWSDLLRRLDEGYAGPPKDDLARPEWNRFVAGLTATCEHNQLVPAIPVLKSWLPRAARYSLATSHLAGR